MGSSWERDIMKASRGKNLLIITCILLDTRESSASPQKCSRKSLTQLALLLAGWCIHCLLIRRLKYDWEGSSNTYGRHARKRGKAKNCWTPHWPLAQMFHWHPSTVLSIPSLILAPSLHFSPDSQKSSLQSHSTPPSLILGYTLSAVTN